MTRFISQAACHGQRPSGVAPQRLVSRPHLVARLLENRKVPRVIVAPDGFGKAALACEYAETVFDFTHVFWISGASPCFLRDLDAGVIGTSLVESDPDCALAVFADVPWLDEERTEALAEVMGYLVGKGVEVVATMRPLCDQLGALLPNRLVVDASLLLVTSEEARDDVVAPLAAIRGERDFARRIPCLRWSDDGPRQLVMGCRADRLPSDMLLVLWTLLVLETGTLHDVQLLLGQRRGAELWNLVAETYPFAGIEPGDTAFSAISIPMEVLHEAFGSRMGELAQQAGSADRDSLALRVAGWLVRRGDAARAADLLERFATRGPVAQWLTQFGWQLLWAGCGQSLRQLYDHVARQRLECRPLMNALVAWAWLQEGDRDQAVGFARRTLSAPEVPRAYRAAAALVAHAAGNASVRAEVDKELVAWRRERAAHGVEVPGEELLDVLVPFALGERTGSDGAAQWLQEWDRLRKRTDEVAIPSRAEAVQAALLGASWLLESLTAEGAFEPRREDEALLGHEAFRALVQECRCLLVGVAGEGVSLGRGGRRVAEMLDIIGASTARMPQAELPPKVRATLELARCDKAVPAHEPAALAAPLTTAAGAPSRRRGTPAPRDARAVPLAPAPPMLHVRLFGSMKAIIGGEEVSDALLSKRKARLLLALLVLNRGHDLTREELAAMLWPCAVPRTALKSFYRLWQELAGILSVEGECPYLLRDRHRCRLNAALFTSDVMEFEALMRSLLFGLSSSAAGWESVLRQVQESFASVLMPGEERCEAVVAARAQFAMDLVDGLVAASTRLRAGGNPQAGLWFAREAFRRERTREDVYEALMAAQIAAGQRSAAMETYLACRTFLSEHLGLDPSARLKALYGSLLDGDVAVR